MSQSDDVTSLSMTNNTIAFEDMPFLRSDACRGLRLELEFLKPEVAFEAYEVAQTIVIFGSARILPPEQASEKMAEAREALSKAPDDSAVQQAYQQAKKRLENSRYYQVARDFSSLITYQCNQHGFKGKDRFIVMTGGGGGIMEAGNRGASDMGGISAALNITLPYEEHPNSYITPGLGFQFHYFNVRKMHFLKRAKVLACFPGGMGTLDELFEALTLIQTRIIERIPVLLFGRAFWEKLIHWDVLVENGMISPEDVNLFTYCETAEDGWNAIREFYGIKKKSE